MKKNVGNIDKIIRVIIAVAISALYFTDVIPGIIGIILMAVSGIFVVTSLISFCPLYAIFGIGSCPIKQQEEAS